MDMMTCVKCGGTEFSMAEDFKSSDDVIKLQCDKCGTVVGQNVETGAIVVQDARGSEPK